MKRMTEESEAGGYRVDADTVAIEGSYCTGDAIEKLAAYENMQEALEAQHRQVSEKLESLKLQGKLKTSTAQQLLAQKLTFSNMLNLFEFHDVGKG